MKNEINYFYTKTLKIILKIIKNLNSLREQN